MSRLLPDAALAAITALIRRELVTGGPHQGRLSTAPRAGVAQALPGKPAAARGGGSPVAWRTGKLVDLCRDGAALRRSGRGAAGAAAELQRSPMPFRALRREAGQQPFSGLRIPGDRPRLGLPTVAPADARILMAADPAQAAASKVKWVPQLRGARVHLILSPAAGDQSWLNKATDAWRRAFMLAVLREAGATVDSVHDVTAIGKPALGAAPAPPVANLPEVTHPSAAQGEAWQAVPGQARRGRGERHRGGGCSRTRS
jgi:hypothetical protein